MTYSYVSLKQIFVTMQMIIPYYVCDSSLHMTLNRLQKDLIQVNAKQFQLMILGNIKFIDEVLLKGKDVTINTTDSINLLGINIDKKLTFICAKQQITR